MAHVFISYKHGDNPEFIEELKRKLEGEGFEIWLDDKILGGEKWSESIEQNIRSSFVVIVVATSRVMESEWINYEYAFAMGANINVIPLLLDEKIEAKLSEQLRWIQGIKFYEEENWGKLFRSLRKYRDETWMKYWIPVETPLIIRSALMGLMETDDASDLNAFARILEKHGNQSSVTALINALDNSDEIIRAKAAWALGPIRQYPAVEPLIKTLDDNNPVVIAHAAGALGHIGDSKAIQKLSELLRNKSVFSSLAKQPYRQDTVSNQALMALNLIGTKEALSEVEKWKKEQ